MGTLRICKVSSNFQPTGSMMEAEESSRPEESSKSKFDVRSLLERSEVQRNPDACPVGIRLGSKVQQTGIGGWQSLDIRVGEEKFHELIITRNLLSFGWYNSRMDSKLTHLDDSGRAHMVDVGEKAETVRMAIARGEVLMKKSTLDLIHAGAMKKGDVLTVAQIAGITAAKRTADLIPLCHPLPLAHIEVELSLNDTLPGVEITSTIKTTGKTGVEMEALTAVSVAALTVYDMAKAAEKTMKIQNIRLIEKHGGRSGDIVNEAV